jgi:type IV secretory pathway TraG/TraD family ATPase VirD4
MTRRYAQSHDGRSFVMYTGDALNYSKIVWSEADADAWVAAWAEWARSRGRDVTVSERPKEDAYEPS